MQADIEDTLRSRFGLASFRPGQKQAIQALLGGQDALVVMPTGAGKSLVYQLASLHLPGLTLVISPLIALMKDQVDQLTRQGIPATYINSSLSRPEQEARLAAMRAGAHRLIYVAPERLRSASFREALSRVAVSLLAVDEAHCISQWGHDFRPDYLHIGEARQALGGPLCAALTATATSRVQQDMVTELELSQPCRVVTGFNRPNIALEVKYTQGEAAKLGAVQALLGSVRDGAVIIYVGSRREAEQLAEFATEELGLTAGYYHAGAEPEHRARIQDGFISGRLRVVAATNAFGMGIDRPDVRMVLHYDIPGTLEAYYQEAGRAGRDGQPARAVLLYDPRDRALQEWFIAQEALTSKDLRLLFDVLARQGATSQQITLEAISQATAFPSVKAKLALQRLEQAGGLSRQGDEGVWMTVRPGTWNQRAAEAQIANQEEHRRYRQEQLAEMIAYAESSDCRRRILLDHFGDREPATAPVCCDNCQSAQNESQESGTIARLSRAERAALIILDTVQRLEWSVGRGTLAQLLKGSRASRMQQVGYDQNVYYGRLAVLRTGEIEGLIDQMLQLGHLKTVGGIRPVLMLTPQGKLALEHKAAIPLELSSHAAGSRSDSKRQNTRQTVQPSELAEASLIRRVVLLGESRDASHGPELCAALLSTDSNVRRLAASALGKLGDERAVVPLMRLLESEDKPQVRQYAVTALGRIGAESAREVLWRVRDDPAEQEYTRSAARAALRCIALRSANRQSRGKETQQARRQTERRTTIQAPGEAVTRFLTAFRPRALRGPWDCGWALGDHSAFSGGEWARSGAGELAYRLKYQGDRSALEQILRKVALLRQQHPELFAVDAIVPVPPSMSRDGEPVLEAARALGQQLDVPVLAALVKTRPTRPQKEMRTLAEKRANVAGAFAVQAPVGRERLLVVDDLYDSGETLAEATRVLKRAGAAAVCVFALSKTIHTDA